MKVSLNQEKCVASGQCVVTAPDIFDQREEDGVAVLRTTHPSPGLAGQVRHAAVVCPALAITVEE